MVETASSDEVRPFSFPSDRAFGQLVLLCMRSDVHRRWSVDDLATNFLPPIGHGQYQLYRAGQKVVGGLTWAWLDAATEAKLLTDGLTPPGEGLEGWRSPLVHRFSGPSRPCARDRTAFHDASDAGGNRPRASPPARRPCLSHRCLALAPTFPTASGVRADMSSGGPSSRLDDGEPSARKNRMIVTSSAGPPWLHAGRSVTVACDESLAEQPYDQEHQGDIAKAVPDQGGGGVGEDLALPQTLMHIRTPLVKTEPRIMVIGLQTTKT